MRTTLNYKRDMPGVAVPTAGVLEQVSQAYRKVVYKVMTPGKPGA